MLIVSQMSTLHIAEPHKLARESPPERVVLERSQRARNVCDSNSWCYDCTTLNPAVRLSRHRPGFFFSCTRTCKVTFLTAFSALWALFGFFFVKEMTVTHATLLYDESHFHSSARLLSSTLEMKAEPSSSLAAKPFSFFFHLPKRFCVSLLSCKNKKRPYPCIVLLPWEFSMEQRKKRQFWPAAFFSVQ